MTLTYHRVDPTGPTMEDAEYQESLTALGGDDANADAPYERIAVVADNAGQARYAFVDEMQRRLGLSSVEWVQRPTLGERREGSVIRHVVTARFRIVE